MPGMKLIHTADVHLGASSGALGERGSDHRRRIRAAFEKIVDLTLERSAQALIIAGDLFDSRRPAKRDLDFALAQLQRLGGATPPVEVFLLPGTHDCWAEDAVYASPRVAALPEYLHVLGGPEPVSVPLPHLDLTVHGCPHICDRDGQRPLAHLRPSPETRFNVGVIHGSAERGDIEDDSSMFSPEEIAASGMDYIALGHWHSHSEHSAGGVIAVYPGSPEIMGFEEREPGVALQVTLDAGGVSIENVPVGTLRARDMEIDAADVTGTEDLRARLAEYADSEMLIQVSLKGLAAPGVVLKLDEIREDLAQSFYALRIVDSSHPALDDLDTHEYDPRLALGKFVEMARERIQEAEAAGDERARRIAERALQLGVALLRGEEVLK